MKRFVRLTLLSAVAAGLAACGGGAKLGGGKDGAAQAAFQASQPVGRKGNTAQNLLDQALASGATTITITADCTHGGTAALALDASQNTGGGTTTGSFTYDVTYDGCNEDGKNEYNGTMKTTMSVDANVGGGTVDVSVIFKMNGKLEIEGEVSDYVEATNLTMTMKASASSANQGSNVTITVNGAIETSSGSFTYSNETISVVSGELPTA